MKTNKTSVCSQNECFMLRNIQEIHTYNYIHMKNIRCLNLLNGYILMIRAKKKRTKWHANREAYIYIYIYNGTTKKKREGQRQTITKF
jgi:uncharacterized protein involved in tellurium resistance